MDQTNANFVELLTASHDKLRGYLMSLLGSRADAEDVLQRSSVIMWQKFDNFEPGTDFVAWASTICFYEAKNFLRLAVRSPLRFDDELLQRLSDDRLNDLENQEPRLRALDVCLKRLRDDDSELIKAAYLDDGQISELALKLNRSTQTIYNKLNLLRKSLADCVRKQLAETT